MSTTKKIIICAIVVLCGVGGLLLAYFFRPNPMPVDWNAVQRIPSNVTLLDKDAQENTTGSVALVRYTESGEIDTTPWKVLQFTDMHLTQNDKTNETSLMHFLAAMKRERPDFVVLTGDIITRPLGRARAIQLAEMFEKMGIYWCACLGNHEGDSMPYTLSRSENIRIWANYPHCLVENDVKYTKAGEAVWGLGNTVVNLLGKDYAVMQSMIFMDSGSKLDAADIAYLKSKGVQVASSDAEYDSLLAAGEKVVHKSTYTFLKETQMTWYEEQVRKVTDDLKNGVKTMLFIHIPLCEQGNVKMIKPTEVIPQGWSYANPNDPLVVDGKIVAYMAIKDGWHLIRDTASYEKCYCSDYNNGMYDLMRSLSAGVNALFCGHDHISNSILYQDPVDGEDTVYLCYGVCSGLQSYNLYDYGLSKEDDYSLRGYSVIMVNGDADSTFDLYHIRYNAVDTRVARVRASVACD